VSEPQWVNVHQEAGDQLIFENIGDQYIGTFTGSEVITPDETDPNETFTQLNFMDDGGPKYVNAGYELRQAFKTIERGTVVRITLAKFVRINNQPSPMKSYRVDVANS
jgi:hypothetical protein